MGLVDKASGNPDHSVEEIGQEKEDRFHVVESIFCFSIHAYLPQGRLQLCCLLHFTVFWL